MSSADPLLAKGFVQSPVSLVTGCSPGCSAFAGTGSNSILPPVFYRWCGLAENLE